MKIPERPEINLSRLLVELLLLLVVSSFVFLIVNVMCSSRTQRNV